jgi:hypothetical protein
MPQDPLSFTSKWDGGNSDLTRRLEGTTRENGPCVVVHLCNPRNSEAEVGEW